MKRNALISTVAGKGSYAGDDKKTSNVPKVGPGKEDREDNIPGGQRTGESID